MDLVAFLNARLDEDEAVANAAATSGNQFAAEGVFAPEWRFANDSAMVRSGAGAIVFGEGAPSGEQAVHIACHDPARVLREVAAERAMLEDLDLTYPDAVHLRKLLAAAWSDHPDYQQEWAV